MNYVRYLIGIFIFCITSLAHAYVINDVRELSDIYSGGESTHWKYRLTDYGFVEGRDTLVGDPILTLEIYDSDYWPDKDWSEQPFFMLTIDLARYYKRIGIDDWEERGFFLEDGTMPVGLVGDFGFVHLGKVTLTFEFLPGPAVLAEPPLPLLILIGLSALGLIRYRWLS